MKNKFVTLLASVGMCASLGAQTWIWYPGDYEIWLGNQMNNRRTERGAFFPPFWKTDSHYVVVEFSKEVDLPEAETIQLSVEGRYNVKLDGKLQFGMPDKLTIPAGKHKINIKVWNQLTPPALYVDGRTIKSDASWKVTYEDKEWIDESGKASDTSATVYMDAGSWNFNSKTSRPSLFRLPCKPLLAVSSTSVENGILYDFGRETFGYLDFSEVRGEGKVFTREFFIDGIKRDRWVWSGDAIQSYLMNYYLFFDSETVKRTIWQLRGKDPVTSHINTIMDYTFYWFLSVYDYYMYTGDEKFVKQLYPRMKSLMEYVLGRTDSDGMVQGMTGDWVFVDWADGYLDKKGQLAFEQVLFCKSLETMVLCARLAGEMQDAWGYEKLSSSLRKKLEPAFWSEDAKALVHNRIGGNQSTSVTRYANMFAVFYDYLSEEKQQLIKQSVLLNDSILKITTPYMRFYELEALCALGEQEQVMEEMLAYWGGMLKEGATSFWEKYNPDEKGAEHLAMYGRPYGKSLCHAWGASPIYLLGKYYLGVKPVKPGYEEYAVTPALGGLKWMKGSVPVPGGEITVYMDRKTIRLKADKGKGYLYVAAKKLPKASVGEFQKVAEGKYRLWIDTNQEVTVHY